MQNRGQIDATVSGVVVVLVGITILVYIVLKIALGQIWSYSGVAVVAAAVAVGAKSVCVGGGGNGVCFLQVACVWEKLFALESGALRPLARPVTRTSAHFNWGARCERFFFFFFLCALLPALQLCKKRARVGVTQDARD